MRLTHVAAAAIGGLAIVAVTSTSALAFAGPSKCSGGKVKNAGKKAAAKLTCLSKAVGKSLQAADSTCLAKADVKFSQVVAKAEAKIPNDCLTTGDTTAIEAKIDAFTASIDGLVAGPNGTNSACDAAKTKAAGKRAAAKLACVARTVGKALHPVDSTCLAKTEVKFSQAAAKADAKSYSDAGCTATSDAASYEALVDAAVDDIDAALGFCDDCCGHTTLRLTTEGAVGDCGAVTDAGGVSQGPLACSGLYFGGSGVQVPLPGSIPGGGQTYFSVSACDATSGAYTIEGTTASETPGGARTCSAAGEPNGYPRNGCLFGAPLAVVSSVTPAASTCVVSRITSSATGTGNCDGTLHIDLDLGADLYLTGDLLTDAGIQPCPICDATTHTCKGGPNNTLGCTPATSAINASYPTSHDCPPPESSFIGALSTPFALTTGSATSTATDTDGAGGQVEVFCGYCRQSIAPNSFQNPAHACSANTDCSSTSFPVCRQRNDGAFGFGLGHTITDSGSNPGCLSDGAPHLGALASTFCIPPSFNGIVDGSADLPGPGAVRIPGNLQLLP